MEATTTQSSWFSSLKNTLSPSALVEKVRDNKQVLLMVAIYAGIGFIIGFLFKRLSTFIVFGIIMLALILLLQHYEIVSFSVHWQQIIHLFGLQESVGADVNPAAVVWEWAKSHVYLAVSFGIGFFLGIKCG
jgi:uncharacterized membrane protein (Fun14 family)